MKWLYHTEDTFMRFLPEEKLTKLGRDGWEMCGVTKWGPGLIYYFKKPDNG